MSSERAVRRAFVDVAVSVRPRSESRGSAEILLADFLSVFDHIFLRLSSEISPAGTPTITSLALSAGLIAAPVAA